jgi:hypothetical protein
MDSYVSPKDEIWFLRVCHRISTPPTTGTPAKRSAALCRAVSCERRKWQANKRKCAVVTMPSAIPCKTRPEIQISINTENTHIRIFRPPAPAATDTLNIRRVVLHKPHSLASVLSSSARLFHQKEFISWAISFLQTKHTVQLKPIH